MALVDKTILQKYTVAELDKMHDLIGQGRDWKYSSKRKKLVQIEKQELALIKEIIEAMHIVPKEPDDS